MSEAVEMLLGFGWYRLNLKKIKAQVESLNTPSIKLLEKLDFKKVESKNNYDCYHKESPPLQLRSFREGDEIVLERLFYYSIRRISSRHYNQKQIEAWAPDNRDMSEWKKSFDGKNVFIAELDHKIVGFAELEENGHIDRFYCSAFHQGLGIGRKLIEELERTAIKKGIKRLFVEASITAKPFFEKFDYNLISPQVVTLRGEEFTNYKMDKILS